MDVLSIGQALTGTLPRPKKKHPASTSVLEVFTRLCWENARLCSIKWKALHIPFERDGKLTTLVKLMRGAILDWSETPEMRIDLD